MSRAATLAAAAARLAASSPAGAAAVNAVSAKAGLLLATAFPAGPVLLAVRAGVRAVLKDLRGNWAARERCRQAAWADLLLAAGAAPTGAVVYLDSVPTSAWADCWHRGLKTSDRRDGRLSYQPAGAAALNLVVREDFAGATWAGSEPSSATWPTAYGPPGPPDSSPRPFLRVAPWMGPWAIEGTYGLRAPYGEEAEALALAAAEVPPGESARRVVADRLRACARWWRDPPPGVAIADPGRAAEYELAADFAGGAGTKDGAGAAGAKDGAGAKAAKGALAGRSSAAPLAAAVAAWYLLRP